MNASSAICDKIEGDKNTCGEEPIGKESLGMDDAPNTIEINEGDIKNSNIIEIDSNVNNPSQGELDVHVHHSKCNNEINDNTIDTKTQEKSETLEFGNGSLQDFDEHDDYEDFDEEDLHAGENFWCSLCDDGGDLLFCDGPCLRTFHGCVSAKKDHDCKTLGFTKEQYQIIVNAQTWICPNCETNQQICFLCHQLGKSIGPNQEVFNCHSAHCGQFYHPKCIAKWVVKDKDKQKAFADSIEQNEETFLCPLHTCKSCKKLEDATNTEKKFAKCRRCPIGWHVDCLPKDILFEEEAEESGIPQRAWKVELGDEKHQFRVGIYCPNHDLSIHPYDMVKFPYRPDSRFKCVEGTNAFHETMTKESLQLKNLNSNSSNKITEHKDKEKLSPRLSPPRTKRKKLLENKKYISDDSKVHETFDEHECSHSKQSLKIKNASSKKKPLFEDKTHDIIGTPLISLSDIKRSVDNIILKSKDRKKFEEVKKSLCTPSFYTDKNGEREGKFIHEGELISILTSIPKALNWIKSKKRIDEAKALCPLRSIIQLERVEKALEAFLNPCLHGQRYTSFGRHFTKRKILIEIVDRLQWYVKDKDMIVDFCCGANEFSIEVHRKLIEVGKKNCSFKNFDILAPKNEFNFEQRDWFTTKRHELPSSDRLIMGLNPPFGKRCALANAFIDHAIIFRPKIIVLIVPPSTKRLEEHGYELIWQDPRLLGGQAFYLPGSICKDIKDANGISRFTVGEDWNKNTPPLYLWSRKDWVVDHLEIARQHDHISDLNANKDLQQFNPSYKSKVDWDKINNLKTLQQLSIVEKSRKNIHQDHKNGANGGDVGKVKVGCVVKETLQTSMESKPNIFQTQLLKMPSKTPKILIDDEIKSSSDSRRRKLVKKTRSSSQQIDTKVSVKDGTIEKVDEVLKQNSKSKCRDDSNSNTNENGHLERPIGEETLERRKSPKQISNEKIVKESASLQLESTNERNRNSINLIEEAKELVDEEHKHNFGKKFEENVHRQYPLTRLKRERSPSMIFDRGEKKTKKSNDSKDWHDKEFKRPMLKDEKQTRNNAYDLPKDIIHQQRIIRRDEETSHSNKFNAAQEDVKRARIHRIHHGRQEAKQERASRIHHERLNIEQERTSRIHHRRQDDEHERASRIHHGRQDIEQERANRIHRGPQEVEQERVKRMHHHRGQDIERRERSKKHDIEMGKEMSDTNNSKYEDSRRNYSVRDISPEPRQLICTRDISPKSRWLSSSQDFDHEFRRSRSPRGLSPKSRYITNSRDMFDQQRFEAYDKYNLKNFDHDIRRSPEKSREVSISRAQCVEDDIKGITYPKWFTAQTNPRGSGRIEGSRATNLPMNLEIDTFERDSFKFPTLHGNYGSCDIPTRSQPYNIDYPDLIKGTCMDLHSPRHERDYLSSQDMTYMQRNNYDILGVHNSTNDFNSFDFEKKKSLNQRFGMNNLHSFDNFDGNIGRDYGINDFPQSSLLGSDIPNLSKDMHGDSWSHLSQNDSFLTSYRNDINHPSTKIQDYTSSWNNIVPTSSPPSNYRHSTFENPHLTSLGGSWNQPSLYPLPSTNIMPFSQRELWP